MRNNWQMLVNNDVFDEFPLENGNMVHLPFSLSLLFEVLSQFNELPISVQSIQAEDIIEVSARGRNDFA